MASTGMDLVISQIVSPRSSLCALICLFSCTRKDHNVGCFGPVMMFSNFSKCSIRFLPLTRWDPPGAQK